MHVIISKRISLENVNFMTTFCAKCASLSSVYIRNSGNKWSISLSSSLLPVVCRRVHVLFTLFVFVCVYWCSTHIVLSLCFVFLLLVYSMVPVSLDCSFLIVPTVFSNVDLVPILLSLSWIYANGIKNIHTHQQYYYCFALVS